MVVDRDIMQKKVILQSVPIPPWHTLGVVAGIMAVSIRYLPTVEDLDEIATIGTLTGRVFPKYVSLPAVAYIRAIFAIIIWSSCYYSIFYGNFTLPN